MKLNEFESLIARFDQFAEIARQIHSSNPDDDDLIKLSIAGFSANCSTEQWGVGHLRFVKERMEGDFSVESLSWYEPYSRTIQRFSALCFGYLLGQYQNGQITDRDFRIAEAIIPGLIAVRNREIAEIDSAR